MGKRNAIERPDPTDPVESREIEKLARYQDEGLIPESWRPIGNTVRERLGSIEAKAYTTWLRMHQASYPIMSPEAMRSHFLGRHEEPMAFPEQDKGLQERFKAAMAEHIESQKRAMEYEEARRKLYDESRKSPGGGTATPPHLRTVSELTRISDVLVKKPESSE